MTNDDLFELEQASREILGTKGLSNLAAYRMHRIRAEVGKICEGLRASFNSTLEEKSKEPGAIREEIRKHLALEIGKEQAPSVELPVLPGDGLPWAELPMDAASTLFRLGLVNGEPTAPPK